MNGAHTVRWAYPIDLVKPIHVQLSHKTRELAVKEGVGKVRWVEENGTDVIVLEVRAQDGPTELSNIGYHEADGRRRSVGGYGR